MPIPPHIPPPAPLPPPGPVAAPPVPQPLTAREQVTRIGACLGLWAGGGVVLYLVGRAFLAGWVDACAATVGWGVGFACWLGAGLLLLPFYTDWHTAQIHRAAQEQALIDRADVQTVALHAMLEYTDHYLTYHPPGQEARPRMWVMGVERTEDSTAPPATDRAADVAQRTEARVSAIWGKVEQAMGRAKVETDHPTTALPDYPPGLPTGPASRYTADMRLIVTELFTKEDASKARLVDTERRLTRGRWDTACTALAAVGVLAKDPRRNAWTLTGRYYYTGEDEGIAALHELVADRVQAGVQ